MRRVAAVVLVTWLAVGVAGASIVVAHADGGLTPPVAPARHLVSYVPAPLSVVDERAKLVGHDERRAVVLSTSAIELVRGATLVRRVAFDARQEVGFADVVHAIDAPDWIEETSPGVFLLRAAFAQGPGTSVDFAAPTVTTLRLAWRSDVFIGGLGATGTFRGVTVTSWNEATEAPVRTLARGRPFILYQRGSTLRIDGCDIGFLGYDRAQAYGLSWREHTTGWMRHTDVHDNFFGVYTFEAYDITYRDNRAYHNVLYGFDPHDFSRGLTFVHNEAYDNGSHGLIFSNGVTDSVVRDNTMHGNGANGIVMDDDSNGNLVVGNTVDGNVGDGIVVLGSSDVVVRDNQVTNNRVGLRLNLEGTGARLIGNTVTGNERGIQVYKGALDVTSTGNDIEGSAETGIEVDATGFRSIDDRIVGGGTGIEVTSPAHVDGTTITDAATGIVVGDTGILTANGVTVTGATLGLSATAPAIVRLSDSRIQAATPLEGTLRADLGNDLRQPWTMLPWLGIAAACFLGAAVVLQVLHRLRNPIRRERVLEVPAGVTNHR